MTDENTTTETILAVRIPADQRDKIRQAAKIEERTESAFTRFHLIPIAEEIVAKSELQPGAEQ
jgi:uncharacterized protein (DUF1778 family)